MMEWVETTARTVEEAKELALDQLGVAADEADFEVLAEAKQGLCGRLRGEARVRARVRPAPVRPKQERRRGRRQGAPAANGDGGANADDGGAANDDRTADGDGGDAGDDRDATAAGSPPSR